MFMKIIIVGCGKVGETLAAELGEEGHDITVVDLDLEKIKAITERLDVMGIVGNGATHTTLAEAGVEDAELLIAVTESDELNLLCCMIAKKTGNSRVIARVRNPAYITEADYLKNVLGLAMLINPEHATAEEIARVLRFPVATKIETFAGGRVELLKFKVSDGNPLIGMSVREMALTFKSNILICTIERDDSSHIANGDFVFERDDLVSLVASPKSAADFFDKLGYKGHSVKSAMIIGAGDSTHYLCSLLSGSGISLKVIDGNEERCDALASLYGKVTVINADESDQELLVEEGIENTDAFVVLTDNDEENILLSLFARKSGGAKTVTKINRPEYEDIIKHLDLDTAVYPKNITADMITRYVRAMKCTAGSNVENMYNFIKDEVEATEFTVGEVPSITGIPLAELAPKLKSGVLIASILRDGDIIIPRGQNCIKSGDSVVIVSKLLGMHDITEILA